MCRLTESGKFHFPHKRRCTLIALSLKYRTLSSCPVKTTEDDVQPGSQPVVALSSGYRKVYEALSVSRIIGTMFAQTLRAFDVYLNERQYDQGAAFTKQWYLFFCTIHRRG